MNLLLQPSTKREHYDISVTNIRRQESFALCTITNVKWVEQSALLAAKYIQLCLTKKFKGTLLQPKAPRKNSMLILVFLPSFTTVGRSVLLMTAVQLTQVSGQ